MDQTSIAQNAAGAMRSVCFTIGGIPVAKGRPRFAKRGAFMQAYTPKDTQNYEAWARQCATQAMGERDLLQGPVTLDAMFHLPVPASWPQWKRAAALDRQIRPEGRPDLDNLLKALTDAFNGIVWRDDAQLIKFTAEKVYGDQPLTAVLAFEAPRITTAAEWKMHLAQFAAGSRVERDGDLFAGEAA